MEITKDNTNLQKYYEYLKGVKADVPPTFDSFQKTLSDGASAKKYYDYLKANKFDAPDTFDSFSKTLGLKKKDATDYGLPTHEAFAGVLSKVAGDIPKIEASDKGVKKAPQDQAQPDEPIQYPHWTNVSKALGIPLPETDVNPTTIGEPETIGGKKPIPSLKEMEQGSLGGENVQPTSKPEDRFIMDKIPSKPPSTYKSSYLDAVSRGIFKGTANLIRNIGYLTVDLPQQLKTTGTETMVKAAAKISGINSDTTKKYAGKIAEAINNGLYGGNTASLEKEGYEKAADFLDKTLTSILKATPEDKRGFGKALEGTGEFLPDLISMAAVPEAKAPLLVEYGLQGMLKMLEYFGVKSYVEGMREGKPVGENVIQSAESTAQAMAYNSIGVWSGEMGQIAKSMGAGVWTSEATKLFANSLGFAGIGKPEDVLQNLSMGVAFYGLSAPEVLKEMVNKRAMLGYMTATNNNIRMVSEMNVDPFKAREESFRLSVQAENETDPAKKAELLHQKTIVDNTIDIHSVTNNILKNPDGFIKSIQDNDLLSAREKKIWTNKIRTTIEETDPRKKEAAPVVENIDQMQKELNDAKNDENANPTEKEAKVNGLQKKINEEKGKAEKIFGKSVDEYNELSPENKQRDIEQIAKETADKAQKEVEAKQVEETKKAEEEKANIPAKEEWESWDKKARDEKAKSLLPTSGQKALNEKQKEKLYSDIKKWDERNKVQKSEVKGEESPLQKRMREAKEEAVSKVDYQGFLNDINKQVKEPATKEEKADLMGRIEKTVEKAGYKFEVDPDEDPDFSSVNISFEGEDVEPEQLPPVMQKIFDNYAKLMHESHENAIEAKPELKLGENNFANRDELFAHLEKNAVDENGELNKTWFDRELDAWPNIETVKAINEWTVDKKAEIKAKAEAAKPKEEIPTPIKEKEERTLTIRKKRSAAFKPGSRTYKAVTQPTNNFDEAALQFFVSGGRLKIDDFIAHTGYTKGGAEYKKYFQLLSNKGTRLDVFHEAVPESFGMEDKGAMDMTNAVIDLMKSYPSRGKMLDELERRQQEPMQYEPTEEEIQYERDQLLKSNKDLDNYDISEYEQAFADGKLNKNDYEELKKWLGEDEQRRTEQQNLDSELYGKEEGSGKGEHEKKPLRTAGTNEEKPSVRLWKNEKDTPESVRARFGVADQEFTPEDVDNIPSTPLWKQNGRNVIGVDDSYMKTHFYSNWTEGGNSAVYPEWNPHGDIHVANNVDDEYKPFVAAHEIWEEYKVEKKGLLYSSAQGSAHEQSNKMEIPLRRFYDEKLKPNGGKVLSINVTDEGFNFKYKETADGPEKEATMFPDGHMEDGKHGNDLGTEIENKPNKNISVRDLSNKTVPELDNLVTQLESGMKDILDQGDTKRAEKLNELIGKVIDARNERKTINEKPNKPNPPTGKGEENKLPGSAETGKGPVASKGEEKPNKYTPEQQKAVDAINKDYETQIAEKEAIIPKAEEDMRKALLEADKRNGLFGDTKPLEPDEIIKREDQGFKYDEETRNAVKKPFEEKIAEAKKDIASLKKEQKSKIGEVEKQTSLFPAEEKPTEKPEIKQGIEFKGKTYTDVDEVQDAFDKGELTFEEQKPLIEKVRKFEDDLKKGAQEQAKNIGKRLGSTADEAEINLKKSADDKNTLFMKFLPNFGISKGNTVLWKNVFMPLRDNLSNWVAGKMQAGLQSQNNALRWLAKAGEMSYRGLARTQAETFGKKGQMGELEMRGTTGIYATNESNDVLNKLRAIVGGDHESWERARNALDPEISATPLKYGDLSVPEKNLYWAVRDWNTWVHETTYALDLIDAKTYLKFKDPHTGEVLYLGRAYDTHITMPDDNEIKAFIGKGANTISADIYKMRQEVDEWKQAHAIKDPTYLTALRVRQTIQNKAIKEYMDGIIADHPEFVRDIKPGEAIPKGFTQLSRARSWGPLRGKAVAQHIIEDFTGFHYANHMANSIYDGLKLWNRQKLNQFYRAWRTTLNPFVQTGNYTGSHFFGAINGFNPLEILARKGDWKKEAKARTPLYKAVERSGVLLESGVTGEKIPDFAKKTNIYKTLTGDQTTIDKARDLFNRGQKLAGENYINVENNVKGAAYMICRDQGLTHEQAIRRVYDSFRNYAHIGKIWDVAAKVPLVGPTFIKFQADMQRIMLNGITMNPLTTIGNFALISAVGTLFAAMSGESKEEQDIREHRKGIPSIPLPFKTSIPLSFKIGKSEINLARYLTPWYAYQSEDNAQDISDMSKFLPFEIKKFDSPLEGEKKYGLGFGDATWGWIGSVLADRDFRGMSIQNPSANKYHNPNPTTEERIMNVLNYVGRSQVPFWRSGQDIYDGVTGKLDFYGRKRTWEQAILNNVVKIQQFDKPELKSYMERNITYLTGKFADLSKRMGDANSEFLREVNRAQEQGVSDEVLSNIYKSADKTRSGRLQKSLDEQVPVMKELERLTNVYKNWHPDDPFIQENYKQIEEGKSRRFNVMDNIDLQKNYPQEFNLLKSNGLLKEPIIPKYYMGEEVTDDEKKEYANVYWREYLQNLDSFVGLTKEQFEEAKKQTVDQGMSITSEGPRTQTILQIQASESARIASQWAKMMFRSK